jgi:hypothetical protein
MSEEIRPDWMPQTPLLCTRKQTAFLLSVCVNTVGNLLRSKQLVGRKVGSKTLITRSSIEAFIRKDHKTGEEGRKHRAKR